MKRACFKAQVNQSRALPEENDSCLRHWELPGKPLRADGQASVTGILEKARPGERIQEVDRERRRETEKEEEKQKRVFGNPVKLLESLSDVNKLDGDPQIPFF